MTFYRKKDVKVEAFQLKTANLGQIIHKLSAFYGDSSYTIDVTAIYPSKEPEITLSDERCHLIANHGDYLVFQEDGHVDIYSEKGFLELYELVTVGGSNPFATITPPSTIIVGI